MDTALAVEEDMENLGADISPNPLKCPPGPLNPLSPERINQQRIPPSPSLHGFLVDDERPRTCDSISSDVQTKVAILNSLSASASAQSSPTRPGRLGGAFLANGNPGASNNNSFNSHNALQRAVMGYEEAQASLASLTAELERAKEELASRSRRELILSQRVEHLLAELQGEKEKRSRDQESYAKEIKRCRKETYRAELSVVEARQELQESRAELKKCQAELQHEKSEKEKSRQESFERAYALAGVMGEMDQLKDRYKTVEKEKDAALLEAKVNAVGRSTFEDTTERIESAPKGYPSISVVETTVAQKQPSKVEDKPWRRKWKTKAAQSQLSTEKTISQRFAAILRRTEFLDKKFAGEPITPQEEIDFLKQELAKARKKQAEDQDRIQSMDTFMLMQCQFKACPCRLAEEKGERFVHDAAYDAKLQQRLLKKRRVDQDGEAERKKTPSQLAIEKAEIPAQEEAAKLTGVTEPAETSSASMKDTSSEDTPKPTKQNPRDTEAPQLPPEPTPDLLSRGSEEPLDVEEAKAIPLPEPQPMELDTRDSTPERTAQLEDITQVLVEPGTATKPFSFSTSTTSNASASANAAPLDQVADTSASLEKDLFDLSPPKKSPPPRPSTATGILTIDSPIRLVPASPRSARPAHQENFRPAMNERNHTFTQSTSTTTKVALKDSPPRSSLHRRAQSRPNLRSHSPLVSSVISQHDSDSQYSVSKSSSASPAPSTLFPITPVHKHSRSMHNLSQQAQAQARSPPQSISTTTTTTRVPLRGLAGSGDMLGRDRRSREAHFEHAHTEVLNINTTITDEHPPPMSQPRPVSTSMLANVPGTPISREAALAQIRARRDRARSVNLKKSTDGKGDGKEKSPVKIRVVGAGGALFATGTGKENIRREISQASAPGRLAL